MATVAAARAALYGFLAARFLGAPDAGTLARLVSLPLAETLPRISGSVAAELARPTASPSALRQDYDDLFAVPLGRYLAPYEAVYLDERLVGEECVRGLLMGPSTLAVRECYRAAGAELDRSCPELPDHVGVELAFLQFLCGQERDAWERDDRRAAAEWRARERHFVERHLLRWVPELCRRMAERAATGFYRAVALATDEFLAAEAVGLAAEDGP
jgi:TorA maturation chaperone TorD